MAETLKKKTFKKAKGKTTNGKTGRATTGRPRATAKPIPKREKAPPAQAEEKQETTASNAGNVVSVPAGTRAIDHLRQEADEYILTHSKELIEGIGKRACEGHNGDFKALVGLASATPTAPVSSEDREALLANFEALISEPDYKQPEDSETHHNPDRGELSEADASRLAA